MQLYMVLVCRKLQCTENYYCSLPMPGQNPIKWGVAVKELELIIAGTFYLCFTEEYTIAINLEALIDLA